ncbi:unnamed protein product [Lepidochelys olivacea]
MCSSRWGRPVGQAARNFSPLLRCLASLSSCSPASKKQEMRRLIGLNIQEFSNINSLKKVPILKDGSFTFGESTAILLYLSRKYNLHPRVFKDGLMENSKIMQESQESLGDLMVIPLFTGKPIPLQKLQEALDELNNSLKKFTEKFLQDRPFIVGSEISLADLVAITELMQVLVATSLSADPNWWHGAARWRKLWGRSSSKKCMNGS